MMPGHDSNTSLSAQYPQALSRDSGNGRPPPHDAFDVGATKRRRDGPSWEPTMKRLRRGDDDDRDDDNDRYNHGHAQPSRYNSPSTIYDAHLTAQQHFPPPQSNHAQTPYAHQPTYPNTGPSFVAHQNIDPAIQQSYTAASASAAASGPAQAPTPGTGTTPGPGPGTGPAAGQQFINPWGMPSQPQTQPQPQPQPPLNRPYQPSSDQFYQPSNEYAPSHMPSQPPFAAPTSAQDWTQPSYSYNGGTDHWNYQIDEPTVYGEDASLHLKVQSIPTLDNLSTQIIMNLAKGSLPDILLLTAGRNYEESQAYFTRRTLFDQTRKVFTRTSVFIDLHTSSHLFTASQQEVIRKANRATFISSILEGHDISFYDLDSRFLDTFIPNGHRLLNWQGLVFLELKTQAYIAALMNSDGPAELLLNELFPNDLDQRMMARHPEALNMIPSELDFLERARERKHRLLAEPPYEALNNLRQKYGWQDFLRDFATCINKNVEVIINNPARTPSNSSFSPRVPRLSESPASRYHPYYSSPHPPNQRAQMMPSQTPLPQQQALQPPPTNQHIQQIQQQDVRGSASSTPDPGDVTSSPVHKTKPGKAAKSSGGTGTPRQPWKREEEEALLAGLAEVKGPHWSQILSLYGRGGSVNEVLKDRNQIQLKDKARNLKLWYLKMGNEVPPCLRGVTGELRKRGGARVRAALGLTDEAEQGSPAKKKSSLGKTGQGPSQGQGQASAGAGNLSLQIDPSLGA